MHIISPGKKNVFAGTLEARATQRLLRYVFAVALLVGSPLVAAQSLVFDRGLPTTNLNNAAGANQSNVQWADVETPPVTPWLPGDDFTLPGSGAYVVTTIRVWSTNNTGLSLRGGVAGGAIGVISTSYTATPVTYANTQSYQTSGGGFLTLYQLDFSVNIPLNGGVTYQFFLDGPAIASGNDFQGAYLHASNAALSGSPQAGANDTFLFLGNDGTVYTWNSATGAGTYCPGCVGWNKASDGNVQVFATVPQTVLRSAPTVSGLGLAWLMSLVAGAGLLVAWGRRRGQGSRAAG